MVKSNLLIFFSFLKSDMKNISFWCFDVMVFLSFWLLIISCNDVVLDFPSFKAHGWPYDFTLSDDFKSKDSSFTPPSQTSSYLNWLGFFCDNEAILHQWEGSPTARAEEKATCWEGCWWMNKYRAERGEGFSRMSYLNWKWQIQLKM